MLSFLASQLHKYRRCCCFLLSEQLSPIPRTGDNGGWKRPERQKNNEKTLFFHTTILECLGRWVTASNQLLALPFSTTVCVSKSCLQVCAHWALLSQSVGGVGPRCVSVVWGNWLYQETDDSQFEVQMCHKQCCFHLCVLMCFACC